MKNCLVTKLKSTVNNDGLKPFGYIPVKYTESVNSAENVMVCAEAQSAKVIGGTVNGSTTVDFTGSGDKYYGTFDNCSYDNGQDLTLYIPKYAIKNIRCNELDAEDLVFATNLANIYMRDYSRIVNASKLDDIADRFKTFYFAKGSFDEPFDVTKLGSTGNLIILGLAKVSNVKGSLDNCGLSPITELIVPDSKDVTLTIENFVANQRSINRTTGSLNISWLGVISCYFNGQLVAAQQDNSLSWTASTITLNGTTIDA